MENTFRTTGRWCYSNEIVLFEKKNNFYREKKFDFSLFSMLQMSASDATAVYFKTMTRKGKENFCFLCDAKIGRIDRNTFRMFNDANKSVTEVLTAILKRVISPDTVHSQLLCKQCVAGVKEYDDLQKRANQLRSNILQKYNDTANANHLDPIDINYESEETTQFRKNDQITSGYSIEDDHFHLSSDSMSNVFGIEHVVVADQNDGKHLTSKQNVVYIKTENDLNDGSILHVSSINDIIHEANDDSQEGDFQTVILEEIDDTQFANHQEQTAQQLIIESKEYFDENDAEMIEISTDTQELPERSYIYQEENTVDDDQDNLDDDSSSLATISSAVTDQQNTADKSEVLMKVKKTENTENSNKILFIRDELNFQCVLCHPVNNVIYDPKTISIHLKTDHNERIHVCDICGADFRKRNPYNEHMAEHGTDATTVGGGDFECDVCHLSFSEARLFRIHRKGHKTSTKIWTCKECGKNYSSKNLLDEHMNMHTGERPYKCPHCTKDFASKYTLTAHMKIHYDRKRPYECKECGKSFFNNQNLIQHERTHTGVKEYECEVCHKQFGTPHNLEVHKIVHTGHKPFICRTCGKAFARRAEIRDHERTHTGER